MARRPIRKHFFLNRYLPHVSILIGVLVIIGLLFNYYVFKPLLPAILTLKRSNDQSYRGQNIFNKIGELFMVQYSLGQKLNENLEKVEDLQSFIRVIYHLNYEMSDRLNILTEDIEDFVQSSPNYSEIQSKYINSLQNVYEIILDKKSEINIVIDIVNIAIKEKFNGGLELINIVNLLNELGVSKKQIRLNKILQAFDFNLRGQDITGKFHKELLIRLLSSIFDYIEGQSKIMSIDVKDEDRSIIINFTCNIKVIDEKTQALGLLKCRAWALANGGILTIHCTSHLTAISVKLSNKLKYRY